MEAPAKTITAFIVLMLLSLTTIAQKWEQVNDFDITRRMGAISFSWQGKGYVGFGHDYNTAYPFNDIDFYDPKTNKWQEATYLDSGFRTCAFSFDLQDELYVGGGTIDSGKTALQDFYKYNLRNNRWSKLQPLPFKYANGARAVVSNNIAYLLGGCTTKGCEEKVWQYNTTDDSWQPGKTLPHKSVFGIAFALNGELYYGLGNGSKQLAYAAIWKTNPADTNGWTKIRSFTKEGRTLSVGIAIDSIHAIAGLGFKIDEYLNQQSPTNYYYNSYRGQDISPESNFMMNDLWLYNALTNDWQRLPHQKRGRRGAISFIAGNYLYIGMGNAENKITKDVYRLDLSKVIK